MRITALHIDGFGIFHNRSFTGLNPRLVLVQGDNEAGKSTLLGFIRSILFGFPRANAKGELFYPPIAGGVHGGRIDVVVNSGEVYTLSRRPGKHGGSVWVEDAMGETGDGELLNRLLGGVTYEVFRNIFAFGLSELQSVGTLQGESVGSAVYGAGFGTGMHVLPLAKKRIQSKMETLFKTGGSKPLVNAVLLELEKVKKAILDAGSQIQRYDEAVEEHRRIEEKIASLETKRDRHRRLQQEFSVYERLWPEWITLQENESALSILTPLVTAFPEDGLLRMEKEIETFRHLEAEMAGLFEHRGQLCEQVAELRVDTALLARAAEITALFQEKGACLEKLQQQPLLVYRKTTLETEIRTRLEALGPYRRAVDIPGMDSGWSEANSERIDASPLARRRVDVFSNSLAEALEGARSAGVERREKEAFLFRAKERLRVATATWTPPEPLKQWLMAVPGLVAAGGNMARHWREPLTGTSLLVSTAILAYFTYLLHRFRTDRSRRKVQAETIEKLVQEAGECDRLVSEAISSETRANAVLADRQTAWQAHLKRLGLVETLPPPDVLRFFFEVEATVTAINRKNHLLEEIHRLETGLSIYRKAVNTLLQALGRQTLKLEDTFPSVVEALAAELEESRGNQREKAALETQLQAIVKRINVVERQRALGRDNYRALLAEAGAESETVFRQKARDYAERSRLLTAIAENEKTLRRMTGTFDITLLKNKLRGQTLSEITTRQNTEGEVIAGLEREIDELRNRRAEVNREIAALSCGGGMATLRSEEARLLAELQAHAFDWSRHALVGYLLDQARESFETAHQPHVIQDAGRFFEQFTGGRYARLMAPLGETTLRAVSADSRSVSPEALSRGTAEQLYLAVRFGFIRHRAKSSEPLPVVMDDILVNFDPRRARAAVDAITELSGTHQIFFFTCHPETIERFQRSNADVQVICLKV